MPIYEYQCRSCGHEFEILQKLSDPKLTDCPQCQQSTLQKKVSAAAFRLKGGGWYETDFKTGNKKNVAGDKAATEGAAKSDSGGDSGNKGGDNSSTKAKSESKDAGTKSSASKATGSSSSSSQ